MRWFTIDCYLSIYLLLLARSNLIITPGSANLEFWRKEKKKKKKKKNLSAVFWLNEKCPKVLSSLGIDQRMRKTSPLRYSPGKKEFFRASLYVWYLQYWALCDDLVAFKLWAGVRYLSFSIDTTPECILWKRSREYRSVWPLKFIKHLADTTCVSPSPAGPTGGCPLNFLYLINLKSWVRDPNGCCIL